MARPLVAAVLVAFAATAAPAAPPKSAREVYDFALKGTAWVLINDGEATGTGWVLDVSAGLLVTNAHVVEGVDDVKVFFPAWEDGELVRQTTDYTKKRTPVKGRVIDRDANRDLALVRVTSVPAGAHALPLAASPAREGDDVRTVGGSSKGSDGILWGNVHGEVRSVGQRPGWKGTDMRVVLTDLPINPGNSGGPLVNGSGEVVGVNYAIRTDARNVSNHIEVREVRAFLASARPLAAPTTADAFLARGKRRFAEDRYRAAADDFTQVIKLSKGKTSAAFLLRGQANHELRDYKAALADFDTVIDIDPDDYDARVNRAESYLQTNDLRKASADAEAAVKLDRSRPEGYFVRGVVRQVSAGRDKNNDLMGDAVGDFTRAIGLKPSAEYYTRRSGALLRLSRWEEAAQDAVKCTDLEPWNAVYHNRLGNIYYDSKNYDKAVACYLKAADTGAGAGQYVLNLADAVRMQGRTDTAVKLYTEVLTAGGPGRTGPVLLNTYLGRGICHNALKNHGEAVKDLQAALEVKVPDVNDYKSEAAAIFRQKAVAHEALGQTAEAERCREQAAKWAPTPAAPAAAPAAAKQQYTIIGTWRHKKTYVLNGNALAVEVVYVFNKDGAYSSSFTINAVGQNGKAGTEKGTFYRDGTALTLAKEDNSREKRVVEIGPKAMVIDIELTAAGVKELVFTRE